MLAAHFAIVNMAAAPLSCRMTMRSTARRLPEGRRHRLIILTRTPHPSGAPPHFSHYTGGPDVQIASPGQVARRPRT